jgi:hypothetical protein
MGMGMGMGIVMCTIHTYGEGTIMPKDIYAIELDTRTKDGGAIVRTAMFDRYADALNAWDKIKIEDDPDVQWWLVKIREGIDDPAHVDALECKCKIGD